MSRGGSDRQALLKADDYGLSCLTTKASRCRQAGYFGSTDVGSRTKHTVIGQKITDVTVDPRGSSSV